MRLALAFLAVVTVAAQGMGQMRDNRDKQLMCDGSNRDGYRDGYHVCDVREINLGPSSRLEVEPGRNGGITVKGWAQNNILVRARTEAWAESDAEARTIAAQINVDTAGGRIRASGPEWNQNFSDRRSWSVSLEVFTPWNTDLKLESHNGGITVSDVRGRIDLESHNGGVRLTRVAGDITGMTHNGAIQVELAGNAWDGRQLELSTYNGGVTLSVPSSYSANIEAQTDRGRLESDFPVAVSGRIDRRNLSFNLGSGGPPIKVSTHNGGIRLKKL